MRTDPIFKLKDAPPGGDADATFAHRGAHDLFWVSAEARTAISGWVSGLVVSVDAAAGEHLMHMSLTTCTCVKLSTHMFTCACTCSYMLYM